MGSDEAVSAPGVHIDNLVFSGATCPELVEDLITSAKVLARCFNTRGRVLDRSDLSLPQVALLSCVNFESRCSAAYRHTFGAQVDTHYFAGNLPVRVLEVHLSDAGNFAELVIELVFRLLRYLRSAFYDEPQSCGNGAHFRLRPGRSAARSV
jgi:hypothetical protein